MGFLIIKVFMTQGDKQIQVKVRHPNNQEMEHNG